MAGYKEGEVCTFYVRDGGFCNFTMVEPNLEKPSLARDRKTLRSRLDPPHYCVIRGKTGLLTKDAVLGQKDCTKYTARSESKVVAGSWRFRSGLI